MNTKTSNAKIFVLQFGALLALYATLSFAISLLFAVINLYIPDAVDAAWRYDGYISSLRFGIAGLIVFAPTYLILTYYSTRMRMLDPEAEYSTLMRWLLHLSLLVAGGVMLGSMVSVIVTYLDGEITWRFILKVLVLLVLLGSTFTYYTLDVREYWNQRSGARRIVAILAIFGLVTIIGLGLYTNTSPSEAREYRFDQRQIESLQQIVYTIDMYVERNNSLPEDVTQAYRSESFIPSAPEGRPAFTYEILNERQYQLCAEFAHDGRLSDQLSYMPIPARYDGQVRDWNYEAGWWCFEIDATPPTQQLRETVVD